MQIVLVRHGKPDYHGPARCSPRQMKDWIEGYNAAEVLPQALPEALRQTARETAWIVCSSLSRCQQSRRLLLDEDPCEVDEVFAEAHLPYFDSAWPRLPARAWRLLLRSAWFLGFSAHTESIAASNRRAAQAAERLEALAREHGSVLLMGHGIMNVLISHQLRKRGWRGPWNLLLKPFWHPCAYRKDA